MMGAIIQARMGSNRLPGKVMKNVDEKNPLLGHVMNQTKQSKILKKIIVATTKNSEDDEIEKFVDDEKISCFRGSSDDVLDRYYQCAKQFKIDPIIRICADCPLIEPEIIDRVIEKFRSENYDYVSNNEPRTFPYGMDLEIFSFEALEKAFQNANLPSEREHVTPYIHKNDALFKIGKVRNNTDYSQIRLTVDRELDLELVRKIISKINKKPILLEDILNLFKKEPELFQLNQEYTTDEGYLKSLKEDNDFIKDKSL